MFDLSEAVVMITGASQGIGREAAITLATSGAEVALVARSMEKLEAVAQEIRGIGRRALSIQADVSRPEEIREATSRVLNELGRLDVLVNNAGITRDGLALRMKHEDWDRVIQTNLTGAFHCIQAVLPYMLKARYGRIINMTSVMGQMGSAGTVNYSASKAGIIGLTKSLAREVASRNITVNAIAPGFIDTAMTQVLGEKYRQEILSQIPLGRPGTPGEVAMGVLFLASPEAGYITGQVLNINGGIYM